VRARGARRDLSAVQDRTGPDGAQSSFATAGVAAQQKGERMTNQAHPTAKLALGTKTLELPVYHGTIGPDVIDIRRLYADGGVFTFDPGYTSTGSCESSITYIDGDKGELLYRGYPIEQLAEKSHFLEVAYLLLYGELPTGAQLEDFESRVTNHTMLHEQMAYFFRGFRRDAHPMAVVCGVMGAMSAFYHDSTDITDAWQREVASIRLIAKMPTIVAMAYKYTVGQPFLYPDNSLSYTANFLRMTFGVPAEPYEVNPVVERAMDRIFILHADHAAHHRHRMRVPAKAGEKARHLLVHHGVA